MFHGSSGSSQRELADAVAFGVVKVNVDTDNQYAFTRAVAGNVLDHWQDVLKVAGGIGDKHSFDPRAWGRAGEAAMADRVRQGCEQLGSAGRSLAASASDTERAATQLIGHAQATERVESARWRWISELSQASGLRRESGV